MRSQWWRWLLVLPGGYAAAAAAGLLVELQDRLHDGPNSIPIPDVLVQPVGAWLNGLAFVYVGSAVAPSHRFRTAVALVGLACVGGLYAVLVFAQHPRFDLRGPEMEGLVWAVFGLGGALHGLYLRRGERGRRRWTPTLETSVTAD